MKLPFVDKFFSKEKENEFFITLEIKQRSLTAHLLEKRSSSLTSLSFHEVTLNKNINDLTAEDIIQAADQAISQIETSAPPGTFIKKTIFTVPYEWQEEGKVKRDHLAMLKRLCDELELTPIGFLVPIEAIIHEMKRKDGALSNAIFLELEEKMLTAYIVRAGSIVEIERQTVEGGIGEAAEELLRRIKSFDVLPGRIIVLRGSQANNVQQELVGRNWAKDLPFLHPPQVAVMEKGFENEATVKGVAEQMKLHVAGEDEAVKETKGMKSHIKGEDLGFHQNIDVANEEEPQPTQAGDIPESNTKKLTSDNIVINETRQEEDDEIAVEQVSAKKKFALPLSFSPILSKLRSPFKVTSGIPIGFKLLPLVAIFLLAGLAYVYYSYVLKADVILYADEKRVEDEFSVVLSEEDSTSKDSIRIAVTEIEIEGSESKNATGKETTGERATGEVTVFNKTEKSVSFSKGEELSSDSGLTFILADDIEIASTSAFSTSFSSKKVKVEAEDFGDKYNLEKNSNFTFDGYDSSDYFAKNSDNFTGGSSKDITVVSEEDITSLEESLLSSLEKEALQKAENDISSKETLIPKVISRSLTDKNFSKDEGDEASEVELSATGVFEIGYYQDSEIENFIKGVSTEDLPEGYVTSQKDSKVEFDELEVDDDGVLSALAKVTAVHLPAINKEEIGKDLSGKAATEAKEIIRESDAAKRFEIVYSRKLPFMPELLPWNASNINVILKTE